MTSFFYKEALPNFSFISHSLPITFKDNMKISNNKYECMHLKKYNYDGKKPNNFLEIKHGIEWGKIVP